MNDVQSLNHSKWEFKYHVTWIPKYRKKKLYGEIRKYLGEVFKELAKQKECEVLEGHLMADHVSTVGRDEETIRNYIKEQEVEGRKFDQLQLFD